MMHEDVIGLFDLACRLRAEAAHGGCNGKHPYRRADRHMLIVCQAHGDGFNRHLPFVHSIPAAPPEAKGSLRPLGRLHLVSLGAAAVCLLIRELPDIVHAREKHHQALFVCTDVRVIRQCNVKRFLLSEHPRGIACGGLRSAEDEKARGHEIKWEDIKLNAYPQHQRHAEHSAEHRAGFLFCQQQCCRRQVCKPIDDQQRPAGKCEVLKNAVCKRQYLKIRQHRVHAHESSRWVDEHGKRSCHGADADKQRPENKPAPRRFKS